MPRERRHDPFVPRVPRFVLSRPMHTGVLLTAAGVGGTWLIISQVAEWPAWMLFPSMLFATLFLVAMMVGLGLLVVCALEPVLDHMEIDWGDAPVDSLGIPAALQRRLEQLDFWTAEDVVRAIEGGNFPWTGLEYDERQQVARASDRWDLSSRASQQVKRQRRPSIIRLLSRRDRER